MWIRPRTTNEVMPLEVLVDDVPTTSYSVAVVAFGSPAPSTGFVAAETDGNITGPRISGLAAGFYQAYPKIGTKVLPPVVFQLTP